LHNLKKLYYMKYFYLLFFNMFLYTSVITAQAPDTMPVYPGCEQVKQKMPCFKEKLTAFIAENFRANLLQKIPENQQVSMLINFYIDIDGNLKQVKVQSEYDFLNDEIERILQLVPPIKPAESNGAPISIQYQLPVVFNAKNTTD